MNKNNNYKIFARGLVNLFYPLVEVSFFDSKGVLQEILNTFSSIKEDQECDVQKMQTDTVFNESLMIGRSVKTIIYSFHNSNLPICYLRLRYDLSLFKNLQQQLDILCPSSDFFSRETIDPWQKAIDRTINDYLSENKVNLQAISQKEKRELINQLQQKGLLDFKESSAYVASKLQISRATVYNYLKTAASFKKVHVHQVDAFTSEKFKGNPAGVVLDADALDEATMRKIARELNLSETAFVSNSPKGAFQIRYFTPTGHEIAFCGHSTVGALYMIAKEKRFGIEKAGNYTFDVETLCGLLKMAAKLDDEGGIEVAYEAPEIRLRKSSISHQGIAKAAGFDDRFIDVAFPVMYEETNKDLFLVIRSLEKLKEIECDPKSFSQFSKQHQIVALCLFVPETFDAKNQFHMRCFAPLVGIPEDPFTGSVLGGLTAYVDKFGLLPKGLKNFRVEQGHFIERPGAVKVEFTHQKKLYIAKIYAQAAHCFSTEIHLT